MQAVRLKQIAGQVSVSVKHGSGDIDVLHLWLGQGIVLHQLIRLFHARPLLPAQLGRLYGDDIDPSIRQRAVNNLNELPEIIRDHLGSLGRTLGEVVVAFVDDHGARPVGDDDAIRVLVEVRELRAAESSIDYVERLHVRNERVPEAKTGASGEHNTAGSGRMRSILIFEIPDGRFPSLRQNARRKKPQANTEQQCANPGTYSRSSRFLDELPQHTAQHYTRPPASIKDAPRYSFA